MIVHSNDDNTSELKVKKVASDHCKFKLYLFMTEKKKISTFSKLLANEERKIQINIYPNRRYNKKFQYGGLTLTIYLFKKMHDMFICVRGMILFRFRNLLG